MAFCGRLRLTESGYRKKGLGHRATERPIKIKNLDFFPYLRKVQLNNEDNEVRKQSENKIEQYDNEVYNEEFPISK